jgi:PPM family protein phosphatase
VNTVFSGRIELFLDNSPQARSVQSAAGLAVGSLQGPVRDNNQDRALVARINSPNMAPCLVAVICDGMGGMAEGGRAATIAASSFTASIILNRDRIDAETVRKAISRANYDVFQKFGGNGGTTLTGLVVDEFLNAWGVHAGDSRLYESDKLQPLKLLTTDDTLSSAMPRKPPISEDELDNRLLQFVGIGSALEPHIFPIMGMKGKSYILTSDGTHSLGRAILEGVSKNATSPADLVRKLTYIAEASSTQDNASVVSIAVNDLQQERVVQEGITVKLWSALETLEIWLPQMSIGSSNYEVESIKADAIYQKSYKLGAKKIVPAKKVATRNRPKKKNEVKSGSSSKSKYQLKIDFDKTDD